MYRRIALPLLLLLFLWGQARSSRAAEVIDGIVATVNQAAILQSDVEEAASYEALVDGRPAAPLDRATRQVTLDRLIDQELLRQQIGANLLAPPAGEMAERLRQLRQQLPGGQTTEGWRAALARYGLSESEVQERLRMQMQISRYIDQRLRPGIHVDSASVQEYYRDQLLPELAKAGVEGVPTLRQVRQQIEEILVQQRMSEELSSWLRSLREQSRVRLGADLVGPLSGARQPASADEKVPLGGK